MFCIEKMADNFTYAQYMFQRINSRMSLAS